MCVWCVCVCERRGGCVCGGEEWGWEVGVEGRRKQGGEGGREGEGVRPPDRRQGPPRATKRALA